MIEVLATAFPTTCTRKKRENGSVSDVERMIATLVLSGYLVGMVGRTESFGQVVALKQ